MFYSAFLSFLFYFQFALDDKQIQLFEPNHPDIQYTGRIDFSNVRSPRFWQPGVSVEFRFKGSFCSVLIADQVPWKEAHNYLTIVVDSQKPKRIRLKDKNNTIPVGENLSDGEHMVVISKATEAGIGYVEFKGILTDDLLTPPRRPERKLEFIGDSITTGTGSDVSEVPCGKGQWHDQHNAYLSYGPIVARNLNAQYHLSAVAGIGLIKSCCNMTVTMPQVFDKINMKDNQMSWSFERYQPDIVTICLGQNDGRQDSVAFTSAYVNFIEVIRAKYPGASIVCMTSPMADKNLTKTLQNYITGIVRNVNARGDKGVSGFFFSKSYNHGCDFHPDLSDHKLIAEELTGFFKKNFGW